MPKKHVQRNRTAAQIDENATRANGANKISNELNLREKAQMLWFKSTSLHSSSSSSTVLCLFFIFLFSFTSCDVISVHCLNLTWHKTACYCFIGNEMRRR
jgi:hypothetical protein